ncbi:DUF423 domain-containing protein [Lysinibacillus sp. 2017]|uniref:DUF423 domain-containing protein n=1 Tax=unclassified Lysinibacillus TaxID=2636778 RepID=UPI000D527A41|nr:MULTISPECIES: DUF423 domain-containing protein [unclassified Lysinibacillus]AWE06247.1 DUF423 domain-containing protein [Lysinibacillus sp. 2017]TGN35277.1 DUF423 domain-containing protein [Lysinibacillus sp. S2017]
MKSSIVSGAIHGFLAVALGAFAAHALKEVLDDYGAGIWDTAVQYQMFHAVALIIVGILMSKAIFGEVKALKTAMICFNLGIIFFSGSLMVLAITGIKVLGAITPIGGVLFLIGWFMIIKTALKKA